METFVELLNQRQKTEPRQIFRSGWLMYLGGMILCALAIQPLPQTAQHSLSAVTTAEQVPCETTSYNVLNCPNLPWNAKSSMRYILDKVWACDTRCDGQHGDDRPWTLLPYSGIQSLIVSHPHTHGTNPQTQPYTLRKARTWREPERLRVITLTMYNELQSQRGISYSVDGRAPV